MLVSHNELIGEEACCLNSALNLNRAHQLLISITEPYFDTALASGYNIIASARLCRQYLRLMLVLLVCLAVPQLVIIYFE